MLITGPSCRQRKSKGWAKQLLYALAASLTPKPHYLWIDIFNTMNGTDFRLLLLPVSHPVLNTIELMWGQIKRYVRDNNCDFTSLTSGNLQNRRYRRKIQEHGMLPFSTHRNMPPNNGRADELLLKYEEGNADDKGEPWGSG